MNSWNGLDFLIFLIFVLNVMWGMVRGASKEIISLMGMSVALIIMIKFTVPLAHLLSSSPLMKDVVESSVMNNFMQSIGAGPITMDLLNELMFSISLLICFVGTYSICEAVFAYPGFAEMMSFPYAALNRKVGGALGATRAYVFTLILLVILSMHIFKESSDSLGSMNMVKGSFFAGIFQSSATKFNSYIDEQNPENFKKIYEDKGLYNEKDVIKALDSGAVPARAPSPQAPAPVAPATPASTQLQTQF